MSFHLFEANLIVQSNPFESGRKTDATFVQATRYGLDESGAELLIAERTENLASWLGNSPSGVDGRQESTQTVRRLEPVIESRME
jgi:hypothetical protein